MKKTQVLKIAKDVIVRIKAKQYYPRTGLFVAFGDLEDKSISNIYGQSIKENFNLILENKACQTCALGACFMSYVKDHNKCNFGQEHIYNDGNAITYRLLPIFGEQLALIENAYERGSGFFRRFSDLEGTEQYQASKYAYFDIEDDSARLLAIMRNIVRNNGEFIIPRAAYRKYHALGL